MISPKQISILQALSEYKFLSRLQLARLGIEKYNSAFSRYCKPLVDAKYIGCLDASNYGLGHVYYLTKKGAQFISKEMNDDLDEVNFCLNPPLLSPQTLFHRNNAIDCQIELVRSCQNQNVEILFYDREIETLGNIKRDNNLMRKTRVPIGGGNFLEPDGIFMLDTRKGNKLYCLEYENKDNTKKSFEKIQKHIQALNMKSPSQKYQHNKAHRALFIYQNPSTMKAVMEKARENIQNIGNWILFKSFNEVISDGGFKNAVYQISNSKDFFNSWRNINEEEVKMY